MIPVNGAPTWGEVFGWAIAAIAIISYLVFVGLAAYWMWRSWKAKQARKGNKKPAFVFAPIICDDSDDKELNELSGTWRFIKAWAESELESARKKNDAALDAERTASLRGEIRVLKRLVNLPDVIRSRDNRLKYSTPPQSAGGDDYGDE